MTKTFGFISTIIFAILMVITLIGAAYLASIPTMYVGFIFFIFTMLSGCVAAWGKEN